MDTTTELNGFRLAYERTGRGPAPVVLLHGWPGDHTDYRDVAPLLADQADVVVPDLRGFGASDKPVVDPAQNYDAEAQAASVAALIVELDLHQPVVVGYDVGSRVAQALARRRPDLVRALVIAPPVPGVGDRVLGETPQREFWYQPFHRLPLSTDLIDGHPDAVRRYLAHFWAHWSGPSFTLGDADLEHLVEVYGAPGAFAASIAWYRAGAGTVAHALAEQAPAADERLAVPTTILWPEYDPLFPRDWADRVEEFFADVVVHPADGIGHFVPREAPELLARHVLAALNPG